ncbi:MAG: 50S ribosomal protein L21 [Clostridia bacterium]|nr:50S ribosomal protein L21 [Clostridia bacterium]
MYAVIETGGKQYKVENGDVIYIEKLEAEDNTTVEFNVVAVANDDGITVGAPYVEGAKVTAEIVKSGKGKKITVSTYKPKKGEKRKLGHRQPYTKAVIKSITV